MFTLLKRWSAEWRRRRAAVRAARDYAALTTGRPVARWTFGHCRAVVGDRCYVCVLYRDQLGCRRGLFVVHRSGTVEVTTAREIRAVRPSTGCSMSWPDAVATLLFIGVMVTIIAYFLALRRP